MSFFRLQRRLLSANVSSAVNFVPVALGGTALLAGGYYVGNILYQDKYVDGLGMSVCLAIIEHKFIRHRKNIQNLSSLLESDEEGELRKNIIYCSL